MIEIFLDDLKSLYSHEKLAYLYKNYLSKVEVAIPKHFTFYKQVHDTKINKYDKNYLIELIRIVYSDKTLFIKFLGLLDEDVQRAFKVITLVTQINQNDLSVKIKQRVNFSITQKNKFQVLYYLFRVYNNFGIYTFSLPESIADKIKPHFGISGDYKFQNNKISKELMIYEDKGEVLNNLKNYYIYMDDYINLNTNEKIDSRSLVNLRSKFHITEFYDNKDKNLINLKTKILFNFLNCISESYISDPLFTLKQIFKSYRDYKTKFFTYSLIDHLNFPSEFLNSTKDKVKNSHFQTSMFDILTKLPINQWVSFEEIIGVMEFNQLYNKIMSENYSDYTYFKNNIDYKQFLRNTKIYNQALTIPAIKASMFLFASLGVLDIAYTDPTNTLKISSKDYLSVYDGLRYIRLNDLGEYITGRSDNYVLNLKTEEKIILDPKRLIIKLSEKSNLKSNSIKEFAQELDSLHFKVTSKSFLKGCENKNDIFDKIKAFKKKISDENIPVWEEFFMQIINNSQMINPSDKYLVFELDKNRYLLELFSKDDFLKLNTIKAENFRILIERHKLNAVKEKLKEFGYLLDS